MTVSQTTRNGREDVKRQLKFCIVPVDGERPNFDMIEFSCIRFNTIAIPQYCCKQPTECEYGDKNRPKHEFVIKYVENGIFRWHGYTLFNGARGPTLSVGVKQALE
jgi:hypothetical protein